MKRSTRRSKDAVHSVKDPCYRRTAKGTIKGTAKAKKLVIASTHKNNSELGDAIISRLLDFPMQFEVRSFGARMDVELEGDKRDHGIRGLRKVNFRFYQENPADPMRIEISFADGTTYDVPRWTVEMIMQRVVHRLAMVAAIAETEVDTLMAGSGSGRGSRSRSATPGGGKSEPAAEVDASVEAAYAGIGGVDGSIDPDGNHDGDDGTDPLAAIT